MTPCIIWKKYCTRAGYGQVGVGGKVLYAHRVAYAEANGVSVESLDGIEVRHVCDNPPCVNPEHLVLGTHAQNMGDMKERGRSPQGTRNGQAKLTDEEVALIRSLYIPRHRELGGSALSRRFGVSQQHISSIVNFQRWSYDGPDNP